MADESKGFEWLGEQSRSTCVAISYRGAMRVLPMALIIPPDGDTSGLHLSVFRAALTSSVTSVLGGADLKEAALDASHAIITSSPVPGMRDLGFGQAVERVASAATAVGAAANAAGINGAWYNDTNYSLENAASAAGDNAAVIQLAEDEANLSSDYLLNSEIQALDPSAETLARQFFEAQSVLNVGGYWTFWANWYQHAMSGDPLPWTFQKQIALIPNEIWDAGPEAVAEEIEKLQFQFRTNVAPQLVRDDDAGIFRVEADAEPPGDLAEFAAQRADQALNAVLESVSPNIFNVGSYEAIVISGALDGPRTTSLLATGLYDACLGLDRNIGDRYPEEIALINLKNALAGIVDELCEADEVARRRCANMAGYVAPSDEVVLSEDELRVIPELTASELDTEARDIIESDVERALAELARQEAMPRWRRIRLANWMTTISIYWDRTKKGFKEAETLAKMVSKLRAAWRNWGSGGE